MRKSKLIKTLLVILASMTVLLIGCGGDDAMVTIESTMPGDIPGDKKPKETEDVEKGRAIVFDVTVPEGLPAAQITVKAPGYDSAIWDVWQISGRIPQMSTFIK